MPLYRFLSVMQTPAAMVKPTGELSVSHLFAEAVMVLPKPLYEALPYVYVGFGLLALVMIESGVRFIPGALLILAGLLVLNLRVSHRQEEAAMHSRRRPVRKARRHA